MKNLSRNGLLVSSLLLLSINVTFAARNVAGNTYKLGGTLKGKVSESWIGQGVAKGSNITTNISNEAVVNFASVNAWPLWKAQLTFNADGTFKYYDIDTGNTQANTTPSTPPIVAPGPTRNDNWRLYTGTWKQKGNTVTLYLDGTASGESALYRFYGVNTVPAIPASGDGLFAGQAATANVPTLYIGAEGKDSVDYYYTYRKAFLGLGNPAWDKRFYKWKGTINSKGALTLSQDTIYQISNLDNTVFTKATPASPPTDLYRETARFTLTKKLTGQ